MEKIAHVLVLSDIWESCDEVCYLTLGGLDGIISVA